jgi:phage shock protein C
MNTSASSDSTSTFDSPASAPSAGIASRPRRLSRPASGRMIGGVAAGIGRYLGVDVIFVRIALVVAVFIGGAGVPLYLAAWLLMPDDHAVESIAGEFVSSVNSWRD